jgi:ribose 5-phosphate isomerase
MKQLLFFVLMLFLASSVAAQREWREVDLKINGVGSGTSYSTVIRKFGKPKRTKSEKVSASLACSNQTETHLTLNYSGLVI